MFDTPASNIGNIVRLKSGGPDMTVNMVAAPQVVCAWFQNDEQKFAPFHQDALERVR